MTNYFSAFINKTVPFENAKLEKNLQNDLKKSLHVLDQLLYQKNIILFFF